MQKILLLILLVIQGAAARQTITILSINTALIKVPFFIDELFNPDIIGENDERAHGLAVAARFNLKEEPDIFIFQEVFDTKTFNSEIADLLEPVYPYRYIDTHGAWLGIGVSSGLAILSKYPIEKPQLETYSCYLGEEMFAKKGILATRFTINGVRLYLFNTHLQAGGGEDYLKELSTWIPKDCGDIENRRNASQVAVQELRQAKEVIKDYTKNKPFNSIVLFAGDFNFDERDYEYRQFRHLFPNAIDIFDAEKSGITASVLESYLGVDNSTKRIDYFWLLDKTPYIGGSSVIVPTITLVDLGQGTIETTDHLASIATVYLND